MHLSGVRCAGTLAAQEVDVWLGCAVVEDRAWSEVSVELLASAVPGRTFRWFKGQKHYSGIYWSATTNDHVIYESRLELARLLFADFGPSVRHIVAQPFLLKAALEGEGL